jgi:hypothetical protein
MQKLAKRQTSAASSGGSGRLLFKHGGRSNFLSIARPEDWNSVDDLVRQKLDEDPRSRIPESAEIELRNADGSLFDPAVARAQGGTVEAFVSVFYEDNPVSRQSEDQVEADREVAISLAETRSPVARDPAPKLGSKKPAKKVIVKKPAKAIVKKTTTKKK